MTYRLYTLWVALICSLAGFSQFGDPVRVENTGPQGSADYIGKLDLENDGDLDLFTLQRINSGPTRSIIILFETTALGTQAEAIVIDTVPMMFNRCIITDVDGDGYGDFVIPDLRTVNGSVGMIRIGWKRNNGDGTLGILQPLLIATSSSDILFDVEAVDLDNDGDFDLVCCGNSGAFWIRNDGTAGFSDPIVIADASTFRGIIRSADINNDGLQDIVYAYYNILLYIPAVAPGDFGLPQAVPVQFLPATAEGLAIGDLDNDGNLDLVVCTGGSNRILISEGDGVGLGQLNNTGVGSSVAGSRFVEIADMDNDGRNDLVVTFNVDGRIEWWHNTGLGYIRHTIWEYGNPAIVPPRTKLSFTLIDDDGDGLMDIVTNTRERITVHRNDGAAFDSFRFISTRIEGYGFKIFDIDGDGDNDFVMSDLVSFFLYRNDGAGNFGGQELQRNIRGGNEFAFADMDLDGVMDLVFAHSWDREFAWYPGLGDGMFGEKQLVQSFALQLGSLAVGDFDNDGDMDIVGSIYGTGPLDRQLLWFENLGNGTFAASSTIAAGITFVELKTADMNGDGLSDIVGMNMSGRVSYYPSLGNGEFGDAIAIVSYSGSGNDTPVFFDIGDVDGDGDLDVVAFTSATTMYNGVKLARNNGSGGFSAMNMPTSTTGGIPRFIHLNDDDLLDIALGSGHIAINQAGVFDPWEQVFEPMIEYNNYRGLWCGDVDGDGASDIIFPGFFDDYYIGFSNRWRDLYWLKSYYQSAYSVSGSVYGDANGDGIRQANEYGLPWIQVAMLPNLYGVFSGLDGGYAAQVPAATYQLNCLPPNTLWAVTNEPTQLEITVSDSMMSSTGNNFGLIAVVDTSIVTPSIVYSDGACSGTGSFWVTCANTGTRVEYGTVTLDLDTLFTFYTSTPPPVSVIGNTISWVMDSLPLFGVHSFHVSVGIPSVIYIGSTVHSTVSVETAQNDLFTTEHAITLACSYDPNDKQVSPVGYGSYGAVDITTGHLDYTIRFQNTGSAPAFNVVIKDQLIVSLDRTNIQLLGFSHTPTHMGINPLGEMTIRFDGIMLPDSGASFPDSQGFIKFRISLNDGLPHLEEINNTARIYFDLNSPIITNTVLNTLVDCALWQPEIGYAQVDALFVTEGDKYQWLLNGSPISGATEELLYIEEPGIYTVEVTSKYGCVAITDPTQVITLFLPEVSAVHMAIFPNPSTGNAELHFGQQLSEKQSIEVLDIHGRLLLTLSSSSGVRQTIPRGSLGAGLYIVRLVDSGHVIANARWVLQ